MMSGRSIWSIARFASTATLFTALALLVRGERAHACGWDGPKITDLTTFDPVVIGDDTWDGLFFDPFHAGYAGSCRWGCSPDTMLADWQKYLKQGLTDDQIKTLVLHATSDQLAEIAGRLKGKPAGGSTPFDTKPLRRAPRAARARVIAAIAYLRVARDLEPFASMTTAPPPAALLDVARAGMKRARDGFLRQRYAFLVARTLFYERNWPAVVNFVDTTSALASPSKDIKWRARHYLAGALVRDGRRGRANLELARIGASYPPLAGQASQDFAPMEEKDWRRSLALARDVRERTMLWRLVGIRYDGLAAIDEIYKLDPKSNLLALLVVREMTRAESRGSGWRQLSSNELAARKRAYARIERVASKIARTPGADRPWLMELVAGHAAALRGKVAAARAHLGRARKARPQDTRVANQARASYALALATRWRLEPRYEAQLARTMAAIDPAFGRARPVRDRVRTLLAKAYAAAGNLVEAEFLASGTHDASGRSASPASSPWHRASFIEQMIARAKHPKTAFDRMMLDQSYSVARLERELAFRHLLDGKFATAATVLRANRGSHARLGTDPFTSRIVDCHECDRRQYANARWTEVSMAQRLAQLKRASRRRGETGARAALELGNAFYNITYFGNARRLLQGTHQVTRDTRPAERWYERAYRASSDRERKARAAFLAAKAELARMLDAATGGKPYVQIKTPPRPSWYEVVQKYADTAYHRDVIRECGWYRSWSTRQQRR